MNDDFLLGQRYAEGMVVEGSRIQYMQKIKHVVQWLKDHPTHHNIVEGDDININLCTPEVLTELFGHVSKKKDRITRDVIIPIQYNSYELVNGYRSALMYYAKATSQTFSAEAMGRVSNTIAGYKRKIQDLKQHGEMSLSEGKAPMNFQGYRYLAEYSIRTNSHFATGIHVHLFLLLCWNLIARNVSVWEIMFDHIWTIYS